MSIAQALSRGAFPQAARFTWDAAGLAEIYEPEVNLCVWRRALDTPLGNWLEELSRVTQFEVVARVQSGLVDLRPQLEGLPDDPYTQAWLDDVHELVELYGDLFGASRMGVRLNTLAEDMCPRFHVDKVGVRLLCTYAGPGTEWLANEDVVRSQLGPHGDVSRPGATVQLVERYDVALLKGEAWPGNEGNGLVHRSPAIAQQGRKRILLSIEAIE